MKNRLTENLGLKIGSVLFAAILWLLVTNINDPATPQKIYNVPVEIKNTELITGQGKIYEVLEGTDVIDVVTVVAPRSIIDTIGKENIVAVADMNDLTNLNTISIKLSTNKYSDKLDSISGNIESVKLNIEEKGTIALALVATTSGEVEDGYIVGDVTTDKNLVRVSGPESIISRISKAEINVLVTGFTSDIDTDAEIKLYDEAGVEIPKSNLTLNMNNVSANVEILATKRIPINASVLGTPAAGFRRTGVVVSSPDAVLLAGKANTLKNLSSIDIPDTAVDVTGASDSYVTEINLKEYLPGNVEIVGNTDFNGKITITAFIEPETVKNIMISESDIQLRNVPEGYTGMVTAYEEEFPIQVCGLAADVGMVTSENIAAYVDVAELLESGVLENIEEGYYDVALSLELPENIDLKEKITVRLNMKEQ